MPKGFASLAKRDVLFRKVNPDEDTSPWELVCNTGELPFRLLIIETGVTMEDVMMHIALHAAEYHPEAKDH